MVDLFRPRIEPASDCSVRIAFDLTPEEAHAAVRRCVHFLQRAGSAQVCNLQPAHATVLVDLDTACVFAEEWARALAARCADLERFEPPPSRDASTPVCYAPEFAPDLAEVAALHRLDVETAIRLFSEAAYRVNFFGFAPGFLYQKEHGA